MDNIRTVYSDLPLTIKGFTIAKDDFYTIVLNEHLSAETNRSTFLHELTHIKNGDFERKVSVDLIEIYAHKKHQCG